MGISRILQFCFGLLLALSLAGCKKQQAQIAAPTKRSAIFLPPMQENPIQPIYVPTDLIETGGSPASESFSAPDCQNDLRFVQDLTIPDGSKVAPGELLDKRWLVENRGTCNWGKGYQLLLIETNSDGVPSKQALYPARSGTQAVIRLVFYAPETVGVLRSAWRAIDPNGIAFGDVIYIEVTISKGNG